MRSHSFTPQSWLSSHCSLDSQCRHRYSDARRTADRDYERLANLPFEQGYIAKERVPTLLEESFFSARPCRRYLWALPALNMYGDEGRLGEGLRQTATTCCRSWKQRLNAKTLITTPNSDVIYAMGYLDLKEDGPLVIEVPPVARHSR